MPLRIPSGAPPRPARPERRRRARPPRAPRRRTAPAAPRPFASPPRCRRRSIGSTSAPQSGVTNSGGPPTRVATTGRAHGQRLQQRLALWLDQAGLAEHVAPGQLGEQLVVRDAAKELDARRRDRPQPAVQRTRADDPQRSVSQQPERLQQPADVLALRQRANVQEPRSVAGRPRCRPPHGRVDAAVDHLQPPRPARQPLGQVLRHADHRRRPRDHRAGGRGQRAAPLGVGDVAPVCRHDEWPARHGGDQAGRHQVVGVDDVGLDAPRRGGCSRGQPRVLRRRVQAAVRGGRRARPAPPRCRGRPARAPCCARRCRTPGARRWGTCSRRAGSARADCVSRRCPRPPNPSAGAPPTGGRPR